MMNSSVYKKPTKYDADIIVIGSGAGGSVAAQTLAQHGLKTILLEQNKLGGDCVNYSCIPTKALLETAHAVKKIEHATKYGIKNAKCIIDFEEVKHWVKKAVASTGIGQSDNYKVTNLGVVQEHAHFISPYTLAVGLKKLSAKKFIIATGADQKTPDIKGLHEIDYFTYRDVLSLKKIPTSLAIIGGGNVGYEYAQIFATFGSKVHLFESKDHILPNYDLEVGDLTESILTNTGVRVHTLSKVTALKKINNSIVIEHKNHGQTHNISVDKIMLATGSVPNTDLGLENALVSYSDDGIKVNNKMQTNQKHIYAIGDVTGLNNNASSAIRQGQIAAHNLAHRKKYNFSSRTAPHVVFGYPEVASVGITERQLKLTGKPYQSSIAPIGLVGKAYSTDYQAGFVKIIASHTGTILGASIVSPHAGELISELTGAIEHYKKACDLSNIIRPFGSWGEAVRIATSKIYCI